MATTTKKCVNCKERDRNENMKQTPNKQWFCGDDCIATYVNKRFQNNKQKQINKVIREDKRKVNDDNRAHMSRKKSFNLTDTKKQHQLTQTVYNKLRVLQEKKWFSDRGLEPECISCKKKNMDWCCGHFKSRGAQSNLRYDDMNTYLQCNRYCNMGLSGNIEGNKNTRGYKQGLADRFGDDRAQEIIEYCENNTAVRKFTGPELEQMRKYFNQEIRRITC